MILIQSDSDELTTEDVMDWLYYLGYNDVIRMNDASSLNKTNLRINNTSIKTHLLKSQDNKDIKSYWYRRGDFIVELNKEMGHVFRTVDYYLEQEYNNLISSVASTLKLGNHINSFKDNNINKTEVLMEASLLGLKIPDTFVTSNLSDLKHFFSEYPTIITKALSSNRFRVPIDENCFINIASDTAIITAQMIDELIQIDNGSFLPSLFQEYIEKQFELRIFYLKGSFYPMAIFSQANEKTKTDFRNYDYERPNRCVPYCLSIEIEEKLRNLMAKLEMNSGSIDMIYTHDKEYVFLEVNPIGQFQWLSQKCNYTIEKDIAKHLLNT